MSSWSHHLAGPDKGNDLSSATFLAPLRGVSARLGLAELRTAERQRRERGPPAGHDTRALQAYLGHKNIQHTVRYTELAPHRFKDFWR
jgi:hypothetical protein